MLLRVLSLLSLVAWASGVSPTPSTILGVGDRARLQQVLQPAWQLTDVAQVLYAASSYKHLGLPIPNTAAACQFVQGSATDTASVETLFYAASAGVALDCPLTATSAVKKTFTESLREGASAPQIYFAVLGMKRMNLPVDSVKAVTAILAALKKDDSVLNLGYAFHVGCHITGDRMAIFERIEDAVVQADEVDGRMLQFEGGLSITALVVSGAYQLSDISKKPVPIKPEQAVKFANYFLSRKSVQMAKGVFYLLEALTMFTSNKFHIPVAITLASSVAVSGDAPKVQVRVTDLLGNSLGTLRVHAEQVVRDADSSVLFAKQNLATVTGQSSVFEVDIMSRSPARGFYTLELGVSGDDKRLVGNVGAKLSFKVLTAVSLQNIEFGTSDADQSLASALQKVAYGSNVGLVEADHHQKVVLRFVVQDTTTQKPTRVHQAFVRITHADTNREVIFVAEPDTANTYKFDMDVGNSVKDFAGLSGKYSVELIIGDASISNPLVWNLAELSLKFPESAATFKAAPAQDYTYKARPEIQHLFQSPTPRPSSVVSLTFTVLCLLPLLILIALWVKLGVNLSNFPFSIAAIGFHLGIAAIMGLFCLFWLELNMFTTLRYLLMVGIVTFFCGNSMLSTIAARRKEQEVQMVYGPYYNKSYRFSQKGPSN